MTGGSALLQPLCITMAMVLAGWGSCQFLQDRDVLEGEVALWPCATTSATSTEGCDQDLAMENSWGGLSCSVWKHVYVKAKVIHQPKAHGKTSSFAL